MHVDGQISETYHPELVMGEATRRYVSLPVAMAAFTIGAVIIAAVSLALRSPVTTGLAIYAFIAGPICLAALLSRVLQQNQATERTVAFDGNDVTVTVSQESESFPLHQCCWFRGVATDDSHLAYQPLRKNALLIVFPTGRAVACGLDDAYYSKWLGALTNSQCRKVLRQEGILGLLFAVLVICGLVAGGVIGWRLGVWVQDALLPPAINNRAANLFPAATAILLAWALGISPWFIPGWRRHTARERHHFTRAAIFFPVKVAIPVGAVLAGSVVAGVVLAAGFAVLFLILTHFINRRPLPARKDVSPPESSRCGAGGS